MQSSLGKFFGHYFIPTKMLNLRAVPFSLHFAFANNMNILQLLIISILSRSLIIRLYPMVPFWKQPNQ